jgi:KUP system potassium uptake protein
MQYRLKTFATNDVYHLDLLLGFRVEPRIDLFFKTILTGLVESGEIVVNDSPDFKYALQPSGDYTFMLGDSYLSYDNNLPAWQRFLLTTYYSLKKIAVKEEDNFGLDTSNVWVEKYPLVVSDTAGLTLKRVYS